MKYIFNEGCKAIWILVETTPNGDLVGLRAHPSRTNARACKKKLEEHNKLYAEAKRNFYTVVHCSTLSCYSERD